MCVLTDKYCRVTTSITLGVRLMGASLLLVDFTASESHEAPVDVEQRVF